MPATPPHADHRVEPVERHPRQLRIDDQAAARRARGENGIVAAELASRGFTGGDDGLDGQWGFFQVFGGGADLDRLIPVLGKPYTIVNPGVVVQAVPVRLAQPSDDGRDAQGRDRITI